MISKPFRAKSRKIIRANSKLLRSIFRISVILLSTLLIFRSQELNSNIASSKYPKYILSNCVSALNDNEFKTNINSLNDDCNTSKCRHLILYDKTIMSTIDKFKYDNFFKEVYSSLNKELIMNNYLSKLNDFDKVFMFISWNLKKYRKKDLYCYACYNHHDSINSIFLLKNQGVEISSIWNDNIDFEKFVNEVSRKITYKTTLTDFKKILEKVKEAYSDYTYQALPVITIISDFFDDTQNNIHAIENIVSEISKLNNLVVNIIVFNNESKSDRIVQLKALLKKYFGNDLNSIIINNNMSCESLIASITPNQKRELLTFTFPYFDGGNYCTPKARLHINNIEDEGEYYFSFFSDDSICNIPQLIISNTDDNIDIQLNKNTEKKCLYLRTNDLISLKIKRLNEVDFHKKLYLNIFSLKNGMKYKYQLCFSQKMQNSTAYIIFIFVLVIISSIWGYFIILLIFIGLHYYPLSYKSINQIYFFTYLISFAVLVFFMCKYNVNILNICIALLSTAIPWTISISIFKQRINSK